jgi:hypothetical protein
MGKYRRHNQKTRKVMYPHLIHDLRGLRNFCADRAMIKMYNAKAPLIWGVYDQCADTLYKGMDKRTDEQIIQEAVKKIQEITY